MNLMILDHTGVTFGEDQIATEIQQIVIDIREEETRERTKQTAAAAQRWREILKEGCR
ncbi:hypothetical protein Syun_004729 [Stephania yunnanensis]|uniref:Uncharacterized protein n=1 Tax=Stephania yunnanensis TaxID=152371 RepID=A0AAP0L3J7_9MAGN